MLTIQDTEYPDRLKNIYDPPLVLYVKGQMPLFDEELAVAMVGTRDCTPYGVMAAEDLSYAMTRQGALIVSGLAAGHRRGRPPGCPPGRGRDGGGAGQRPRRGLPQGEPLSL